MNKMKVEEALLYLKGFVGMTRVTHLINNIGSDSSEIILLNAIDIICDVTGHWND